ncbi:MAG: CCA tRNA nucleotidyltransferase [Kordiimonadaceae bacterium]|nr:CCA tRNA nucleotidyltransferase [Kordiimonadaceae bacterium]
MNMNNVPLNIAGEKWLEDEALVRLMNVLNQDELSARIVGGAVRDALFNIFWKRERKIGDIDIASRYSPEKNRKILEKAGVTVIPTGIKHGTITARLSGKNFEITTLRRDVSTDGRHAEVEFTDDWHEDARRRDFTINALYLDIDGTIHDPLGGFRDIKKARVRFIGNARERIKEDGLRILRFFRFSSNYDVGGVDEAGMLACVEQKAMIAKLSGERIRDEFEKLLLSKQVVQIIPVMAAIGILREILPEYEQYDELLKYAKRQKKLGQKDFIGRLSCLLPGDKEIISKASKRLRLSNRQRDLLISYAAPYENHDLRKETLRRVLYLYGKDVVIHNLTRLGKLDLKTLSYIADYEIPQLPISGKELMKQGWKAGRELGGELKRLEKIWIENDFKMTLH